LVPGYLTKWYMYKYNELMKPTFDGNKNKNTNYESNPVERLIAIDQIIETTKIPIQNAERALLHSSILRISDSDFPNVKTSLNVINKLKNKEELKDSEFKKLVLIKESLRNKGENLISAVFCQRNHNESAYKTKKHKK